jgi:hypothetical protein
MSKLVDGNYTRWFVVPQLKLIVSNVVGSGSAKLRRQMMRSKNSGLLICFP